MRYFCKANFSCGKDENGAIVQFKVAQLYTGPEERIEEFKKAGFIVAEMDLDKATVEELKAAIEAKKSELSALEGKLKTLLSKPALSAESESLKNESGKGASGKEKK